LHPKLHLYNQITISLHEVMQIHSLQGYIGAHLCNQWLNSFKAAPESLPHDFATSAAKSFRDGSSAFGILRYQLS